MTGMKLLLLTSLLFASTSAIPAVIFPFNSQVPTAARVGQLYSFQFSASTFAPGDASFIYSLSGQPAWLTLDGASRTLTGTPGQSDTGSSEFILTAADITGAAHMPCTLVVVTDPLPTLQGDLGEQLAESTNLSSSDPPIMTLLPDSAFDFHFRRNSFIDIVQRNLYYYATLSNHTPLPSWLQFDGANLAFSGVAPQLSAFPQSFQVMLIASDVQGFAGSSSTFTIRIGETQLVFVPEEQDVNFESGKPLDEADLGNTLLSNAVKVDVSNLKEVEIKGLPGWMSFDSKTLKLKGDAPDNARAANATLTVKNENGDTAVLVVRLIPDVDRSSLFTGVIGTLDATAGEFFEYTIPTSVIADSDATLMLILPTEARWLQFDSGKHELKGQVPTQTSSIVTATLNARAPNSAESETLVFKIDIKAAPSSWSSTSTATTLVTSRAAPTESSTSTAAAILATDTESRDGLSGGAIAGIVVGVIVAVAILFALLFLCCRRKRRREGYEKHTSTSKQTISRPIPVPETSSIAVTTTMQRDVEKAESMEEERAPQVALNLPPRSARNSKWTGRFSRVSLVSSLGNGEDMIRADSNIPEWGHDSSAMLQMPHESFSVPAQLARVSRQLSDLSPSKGALRRLQVKRIRPQSEDDVGLGIGVRDRNLSPHRAESRRKANSMGLETMMDRSSCGSFTTRGTSMLSTRPSDFPRPPTQESFVESRSFLVGADNKRKSVRLVPRSDSVSNNDRTIDDNANDERSMQEKRQSFIRKRASTTFSSPLWSATIGTHRGNGQSSTSDIDVVSGANSRKSKRIKSQLASYSESSSIQPSRSSNRISRRFRSSFAPNFPRAITRSTLAAEDDNEDNWTTSSESSSSEDNDRLDAEAEMELADEMALPRHERSWVLPNEASPTPPPSSNYQTSSHRRQRPPIHRASTPNSAIRKTRSWNTTASTATSSRSISPLAIQALDNYSRSNSGNLSSPTKSYPRSRLRRSRLSEPMALTAADSLSRVNAKSSKSKTNPKEIETDNDSDFVTTDPDNNTKTGPRLAFTKSSRPISVDEDAKRMSSMRAERVVEEDEDGEEADVRGGALREEFERSLEQSRVFTGGSGKVFI